MATKSNSGYPSAPQSGSGGCERSKSISTLPAAALHLHGNFSKRRQNHAVYDHKKDSFIEWVKSVLMVTFDLGVMDKEIPHHLGNIEDLIKGHIEDSENSRLKTIVPDIPKFFAPLKLREAFQIYNRKYRITSRRFVYPTFNEIRHILNLGQVLGMDDVRLITFDGDQTLYPDQKNFEDMVLAQQLMVLLKHDIKIAVVTAANYNLDSVKYEVRLRGLLDFFQAQQLPKEYLDNFNIVAGESNFLLKVGQDYRIHPDQERWPKKLTMTENMLHALDTVEATVRLAAFELNMKAQVLRKATSVGVIVAAEAREGKESYYFRREQLDEIVFRIQDTLIHIKDRIDFPYCAFNGGNDVWFDVGSKKHGVEGLQILFDIKSCHSLHVGDQMAPTGNDFMARYQTPVSWIVNPQETKKMLNHVIRKLGIAKDGLKPSSVAGYSGTRKSSLDGLSQNLGESGSSGGSDREQDWRDEDMTDEEATPQEPPEFECVGSDVSRIRQKAGTSDGQSAAEIHAHHD